MAQLRQTVLRTEEQLAEVQEALNAERVARKSAVDLVDQLQQVKQDDERESAELRALLAAERQNVETGGREAHELHATRYKSHVTSYTASTGAALLGAGVREAYITEGTVDPQVALLDGKKGSLFDALEDLDTAECIDTLKKLAAA